MENLPRWVLVILNRMYSFSFQLLNGKYTFSRRINSLFTALLKQSASGSLIFRTWKFGIVFFAIKISVNWATGSWDRTNPSDNPDLHRRWKDIQSALLNFQWKLLVKQPNLRSANIHSCGLHVLKCTFKNIFKDVFLKDQNTTWNMSL